MMSYIYEPNEPPPAPLPAPDLAHRLDYFREHVASLTSQFLDACHVQAMKLTTDITNDLADQLLTKRDSLNLDKLGSLGISVEDIEQNCEQFQSQLAFSRESCNGLIPCRPVGELLVPVAVPGFDPDDCWQGSIRTKDYFSRGDDSIFQYLSAEDAVANFCSELAPFLADRLVASSYLPISEIFGGMSSTSRMLTVRIFSQSEGGRVSYSPSYFIKYVALSAAPSPVVSHIIPGRYVFMLTTASGEKIEDKDVFDIPPAFDVHLTA